MIRCTPPCQNPACCSGVGPLSIQEVGTGEESCCPMSYWCTPSGVQPGTPSADGQTVYPPEGATSGPYATEEEALVVCSRLTCDDCEPATVPPAFVVRFEDRTGRCADPSFPESLVLPLLDVTDGGAFWSLDVDWLTSGLFSAFSIQYANFGDDPPFDCCWIIQNNGNVGGAFVVAGVPPGWSPYLAPPDDTVAWVYRQTCPGDYPAGAGPFAFQFVDGVETGTANVYIDFA